MISKFTLALIEASFYCIFENVVIENVNRYVAKQFSEEQITKCDRSDSIFMLVWLLLTGKR